MDRKEADMPGTGTEKSNVVNSDIHDEQREKENPVLRQDEEHALTKGLEAEEQQLEETRKAAERNEQQDLNQGFDTGTHDTARHGVDWGPAYQVPSPAPRKRRKKKEPNK
jgi:hypothetical protein